ncbi:squalene/phytoene synthase family protein [Prochlorothrix hollandica]|uniref:Phytoene synthase n=1 Tax=Prochlorothrix hollandica PCC 9006 = CALU 1027 TaxID=317619 RepID=A0A0M2Q215_PROHO|nr:phytoene/squalene synthase family protein [Prochlorothrix hollandica]KKJ00662.1 phytoene synthase [Prochlorothrix hollandica PCC 9006 = CALU 1027]
MNLRQSALEMLKSTSRTFFIPIERLPAGLQEAVASGYLCMRAIDEVEDHPDLDLTTKATILRQISINLQSAKDGYTAADFAVGLSQLHGDLPEVSGRIGDWALLAPPSIAPRIWDATAAMADRMAYWAERNWRVRTEADLDCYTFSVAGSVGLMLSDLWAWHDGTQTNRMEAIGFGRGLQSVNILRNHGEDRHRGVNFYPDGWTDQQMHDYAAYNLRLADAYTEALQPGPVQDFCKLPLALAHATLQVMIQGQEKLTRQQVKSIVEETYQPREIAIS